MHTATISSRDFARDVGAAKRTADHMPVIITDRGKASHVLLNVETYQRLAEGLPGTASRSLLELMDSLPRTDGIEFDAPRADIELQLPQV